MNRVVASKTNRNRIGLARRVHCFKVKHEVVRRGLGLGGGLVCQRAGKGRWNGNSLDVDRFSCEVQFGEGKICVQHS